MRVDVDNYLSGNDKLAILLKKGYDFSKPIAGSTPYGKDLSITYYQSDKNIKDNKQAYMFSPDVKVFCVENAWSNCLFEVLDYGRNNRPGTANIRIW